MLMKKVVFLLAVMALSAASMAQGEGPQQKYSVSTNSFWSNWFVQTNVTWNTFYTGGQHTVLSSPFYKFPLGTRPTDASHPTAMGFSVALGKWFTPGIALRTKFNGLWYGKAFDSKSGKYWGLNEQVLLNLSNIFCGYNERRVWNLIPYLGAGFGRNTDIKRSSLTWSAGLLNTFRLSRVVALNLEVGYVNYGKDMFATGLAEGMSAHSRDHQFALEIGATFNIGKKGWKKSPDLDAIMALSQGEIDALNAQIEDAQAENARLRNLIASQPKQEKTEPKTVTVTKVLSAPVSVFFHIGQSAIASKKDLQNVAELAKSARENNTRVVVTGYADSQTGSAAYNQRLSQQRAETVAAELVKKGVSRDQIDIVAAGGVDTLTPKDYNRRATVQLK